MKTELHKSMEKILETVKKYGYDIYFQRAENGVLILKMSDYTKEQSRHISQGILDKNIVYLEDYIDRGVKELKR